MNNINNSPSILNTFPFQPKIGLDNINAPCYINPILQCLLHIEEFVSYFKYNDYINNVSNNYIQKGKNCLSTSIKLLIDNIWSNNSKENYNPYELIEKINRMSNLIKNNTNNMNDNIKNFFLFLINTLHEELNQANNNSLLLNNNFINNNTFIQTFNEFNSNFAKNYNSIISELFYAIQMTQTTCLNCNDIQYNFQTYFFLSFPLSEVKQYAINQQQFKINMNNNNFNMNNMNMKLLNLANNIADIFDCFDYLQKTEILTNDNSIFCYNCKQLSVANYSLKLYNSPKILILILDRENIFQNIKIDFHLKLDLSQYFVDQNAKHNYKLIGVVSYIINDLQNWFLISHCLSPIDNKWYTYKDSTVNEVYDFKSQILNHGLPCILFYQKIE